MSNALNNFEQTVSGIERSIDVLNGFANLAVKSGADKQQIQDRLISASRQLIELAKQYEPEPQTAQVPDHLVLDPFFDSKNAFVLDEHTANAERMLYGSNSG